LLSICVQKSDSVNCPIDRGIFRRQERIDEEFDPEEINERLSSTSSHRESERQPEFVPPTGDLIHFCILIGLVVA